MLSHDVRRAQTGRQSVRRKLATAVLEKAHDLFPDHKDHELLDAMQEAADVLEKVHDLFPDHKDHELLDAMQEAAEEQTPTLDASPSIHRFVFQHVATVEKFQIRDDSSISTRHGSMVSRCHCSKHRVLGLCFVPELLSEPRARADQAQVW